MCGWPDVVKVVNAIVERLGLDGMKDSPGERLDIDAKSG